MAKATRLSGTQYFKRPYREKITQYLSSSLQVIIIEKFASYWDREIQSISCSQAEVTYSSDSAR